MTEDELEREALYLIEEKGLRVLELVYSTDPRMRVDSMCRHVELLRRVLDQHGGGLVGISAEVFDGSDYRRLVDAGLCWSVLWQETYGKSRYFIRAKPRRQALSTAWTLMSAARRGCSARRRGSALGPIGLETGLGHADVA